MRFFILIPSVCYRSQTVPRVNLLLTSEISSSTD